MAGPDGSWLLSPQVAKDDGASNDAIFCVNLDMNAVRRERLAIDPSGYYARKDVFKVEVTGALKQCLRF